MKHVDDLPRSRNFLIPKKSPIGLFIGILDDQLRGVIGNTLGRKMTNVIGAAFDLVLIFFMMMVVLGLYLHFIQFSNYHWIIGSILLILNATVGIPLGMFLAGNGFQTLGLDGTVIVWLLFKPWIILLLLTFSLSLSIGLFNLLKKLKSGELFKQN